jgi:hypothetical protein
MIPGFFRKYWSELNKKKLLLNYINETNQISGRFLVLLLEISLEHRRAKASISG